jgi:transcriptional regulator with XRE-family HTH domain
MDHKIHEGRNVKRFREMLGMKQEALAFALGEDWTQKKVSLVEAKETVELPLLERISEVLKIPVDAFKNFDEEQAVAIISNTFNTHDYSNGVINYSTININPVEQWLASLEEVKRLNAEKMELYERMLRDKDEIIGRLEKMLGGK